jgi:hypothetical protein
VADHSFAVFHRRVNTNGTFDLICPFCYLTVAHGAREPRLEELARVHLCVKRDSDQRIAARAELDSEVST